MNRRGGYVAASEPEQTWLGKTRRHRQGLDAHRQVKIATRPAGCLTPLAIDHKTGENISTLSLEACAPLAYSAACPHSAHPLNMNEVIAKRLGLYGGANQA